MPEIRSDAVIFGVLMLSVPLQFLLVKFWGQTESGRTQALNEFINVLVKFHSRYLKWESWKSWCLNMITGSRTIPPIYYSTSDTSDPMGESPAIEVMQYKQKEGYFALSPNPRLHRPPHIKFRVGQVVLHKYWRYRGVIIGWDEEAKAPKDWLKSMYGAENERYRFMPNYAILVDIRDRLSPQITYVPETNLFLLKNTKIIHPLIEDHFEDFDGAQYIPRPWLKAVYPKD